MVRVWAQVACMANSKVANIVPCSPIALEGMPPTDGLLACLVCLSPALVHPLRGAVVSHVGNIEDKGLNLYRDCILYSISLPTYRHFLVVQPEDCRGNIVVPDGTHEKSTKQEGRGQGTTLKE